MKNFSLIFVGLLFLLLLTACGNNEPLIDIEMKVSSISDEEYDKIGTKDLNEPKQEDFKVLNFSFYMEHTDAVTNRQIEVNEDWRKNLNSIDEMDRYWYGSISSRDNASENFAEYKQKIVFYTKGLSEEAIKKGLGEEKITVSWTDNNNEQVNKQYKIADLIEFNNEN